MLQKSVEFVVWYLLWSMGGFCMYLCKIISKSRFLQKCAHLEGSEKSCMQEYMSCRASA